jgi:hypothetical protein
MSGFMRKGNSSEREDEFLSEGLDSYLGGSVDGQLAFFFANDGGGKKSREELLILIEESKRSARNGLLKLAYCSLLPLGVYGGVGVVGSMFCSNSGSQTLEDYAGIGLAIASGVIVADLLVSKKGFFSEYREMLGEAFNEFRESRERVLVYKKELSDVL